MSQYRNNTETDAYYTVWIFQNGKSFNASKEELDFIDNNEETSKVAILDHKMLMRCFEITKELLVQKYFNKKSE